VSLSVDGVVQHVRSRCPCSEVWYLALINGNTSGGVGSANYPAPCRYRERGIVFARFLSLFVCLFVSLYLCIFVSLSARLRENGWTNLHEIFREGVE